MVGLINKWSLTSTHVILLTAAEMSEAHMLTHLDRFI